LTTIKAVNNETYLKRRRLFSNSCSLLLEIS